MLFEAADERDDGGEETGFRFIYCLFCETGQEDRVKLLCELRIGAKALTLKAERRQIYHGQRRETLGRLLPGYVFVYSETECEPYRLRSLEHVLRVLELGGDRTLHNDDLRFARWVWQCGGLVQMSSALREGDHIRIVQGPLKEYEGDIVWVDKRKGKAKVRVKTESMDLTLWMFFDYVAKTEESARTLEGNDADRS
ncbi:MAG: hypothetical protein PHY12_04045 [Eubacteriales bacterium]|nr:hypothetical protein [Eubacteriales bacterium]